MSVGVENSAVNHPEMQDLCHKQQHSAVGNQTSERQGLTVRWESEACSYAGNSGSVTAVGLLTLLRVTAAIEPVTSAGKGSLTLKPPTDCLQQEDSRCLGPVQCTEAHLHKASNLATCNIAATTAGLLLQGSATLLLPGLYSHLYVTICQIFGPPSCLLNGTAWVCRYARGIWSVTTVTRSVTESAYQLSPAPDSSAMSPRHEPALTVPVELQYSCTQQH